MCFGTGNTAVAKLEENLAQSGELEEILGETGSETEPQLPTPLSEALIELALIEAIGTNVSFAAILGKQGVHSVANALLMLPLEGKMSPETKAALGQFIKSEAKRLVAGALAAEQGANAVSRN